MTWPIKHLVDVCYITMGQAPIGSSYNESGQGLPLVAGAGDFNGKIPKAKKHTTAPSKVSKNGDIILGIRASIGEKVWSDRPYCLGRGVAGIRAKSDLDSRFLWYWLELAKPDLMSKSRGATFLQVSRKDIESLQIPLPPLSEQKRIAGILDTADALRAKRRESLSLLDNLIQSTFLNMFGDPVMNPMRWVEKTFEETVKETKLGLVRSSSEFGWNFEIPYVRMDALTLDGKFLPDKVQFTDANDKELENFALRPGDFLFNTRNSKELVGKVCVFPGPEGWLFNNNLLRIRFNEGIVPSVIATQFQFRKVKRELEQRKSGTTSVFAIYWKSLRTLPVLVPPLELQQRFAAIVESIEKQKACMQAHLAELDTLFASLQQRAFNGEL